MARENRPMSLNMRLGNKSRLMPVDCHRHTVSVGLLPITV